MANIHILDRTSQGYRLVLHFAVPVGNNGAGVAWSAALVASRLGGTTVLADGDGTAGTIGSTEKAAIAAGTVHEVQDLVDPTRNGSGAAAINAFLDDYFAARQTEVLGQLQARLAQFGRTR